MFIGKEIRLLKLGVIMLLLILVCGCGGLAQKEGVKNTSERGILAKTALEASTDSVITLYPGYVEIASGNKVKLAAKVAAKNSSSVKIDWVSEKPDIASVSEDGTVKANKDGDTVITATLKGNGKKGASCLVHVKADGPTYLYTNIPRKKEGAEKPTEEKQADRKPEDNKKADEDIPVEYDESEGIPVEVIPSIDEFIWTIKIDDVCSKTVDVGELGSIKSNYHMKLKAIKSGGKTAEGQYSCTAAQELKIESGDMEEKISEDAEGTAKADNNVKTEIKDTILKVARFNGGEYSSYGLEKGGLPTLVPYTPPVWMATGNLLFTSNGSFGMSVTSDGESGSGKNNMNKASHRAPFKIRIGKDGSVNLLIMNKSSIGPLEFNGFIYKKPIRPKYK